MILAPSATTQTRAITVILVMCVSNVWRLYGVLSRDDYSTTVWISSESVQNFVSKARCEQQLFISVTMSKKEIHYNVPSVCKRGQR